MLNHVLVECRLGNICITKLYLIITFVVCVWVADKSASHPQCINKNFVCC